MDPTQEAISALAALKEKLAVPAEPERNGAASCALDRQSKLRPKVGPLKNPRKDVDLVETSLKALGFKVTVLNDADYRAMDVELKRYGDTAARRRRRDRLFLLFRAWSGEGGYADQLSHPGRCRRGRGRVDLVLFLSAKPDYRPFEQAGRERNAVCRVRCLPQRAEPCQAARQRRLGPIGVCPGRRYRGTFDRLCNRYRTASDVGEGGGPYAKALAEELLKPGVEAVTMFRNVQIRVKKAIGQNPWLSFPSLAPVYLGGRYTGPSQEIKP